MYSCVSVYLDMTTFSGLTVYIYYNKRCVMESIPIYPKPNNFSVNRMSLELFGAHL